MLRNVDDHGATNPTAGSFQHVISYCLELLDPYPAGTAIYILSCLYPDVFAVILELVGLDLSGPHQHKRLSENEVRLRPKSYEDLLSHFRACTSTIPTQDYGRFWLELTKNWLLTCPLDSSWHLDNETSQNLYCERLRTELIESILCID